MAATEAKGPVETVSAIDHVFSAATSVLMLRVNQLRGGYECWVEQHADHYYASWPPALILAWWADEGANYDPVLFRVGIRGVDAPARVTESLEYALKQLRVGSFPPLTVVDDVIMIDQDMVAMQLSIIREHDEG